MLTHSIHTFSVFLNWSTTSCEELEASSHLLCFCLFLQYEFYYDNQHFENVISQAREPPAEMITDFYWFHVSHEYF